MGLKMRQPDCQQKGNIHDLLILVQYAGVQFKISSSRIDIKLPEAQPVCNLIIPRL